MSDDQDDRFQRITLRIPKELHARLMQEAVARTRSMNAEIIDRLESSFVMAGQRTLKEWQDRLNGYAQKYDFLKERISEMARKEKERDKNIENVKEEIRAISKLLKERSS